MKHYRIASAAILAGALLSGCFFSFGAEASDVNIEIVEIEEIPDSQPNSGKVRYSMTIGTGGITTAGKSAGTGTEASEKDSGQKTESMTEKNSGSESMMAQKESYGSESKAASQESADVRIQETAENSDAKAKAPAAENSDAKTEATAEKSPDTEAEAAETETGSWTLPKLQDSTTASRAEQGLYEIGCAADTGFVLDVRHCTVRDEDDKTLQAFRPLGVNQQKFYLEALPDGQFRISVLHTGDALTALPESLSVVMSTMEHPKDDVASPSQSWIIEEARQGFYYIRTADGKYLTLDSSRPYAGTPIILSSYTGGFSQMWRFENTWSSAETCADTDLINPYGEDGPYSGLRLSLLFGETLETITADSLSAQIAENESHQLVLNAEFLDSFVAQLAAKYDTQGQPKRFRTSYGNEITLYEGDFGWKLDTAATKALLQDYLATNQVRYLAPVWAHKGWSFDSGDAIGDSYVEVDLTNQKVFLYKDGKKLLETDCVSGTENDPERKTPGGVYSIYRKISPDTLDGPGYSEEVTYWMPFYLGYGLHDATWREEFGGEFYLTDGSHGCINLPLEDAGRIYDTVDIGFPVVLYR